VRYGIALSATRAMSVGIAWGPPKGNGWESGGRSVIVCSSPS
jgi:hypothetical protein